MKAFFPIFQTKSNQRHMPGFIVGRIKSIRYAVKGFFLLLTTENAIIAQSTIAVLFVCLGFYLDIDRMEWGLQFLAIGLVLSIESLNTAVEKICDFIHPDHHEKIGFIKDVASGAVTFAALTAFAIAVLIYAPYLMQCLR
jgi:diacylglycerol kinase